MYLGRYTGMQQQHVLGEKEEEYGGEWGGAEGMEGVGVLWDNV